MSPPSWAYQVESFDNPPDEELVCSVCHCVFCDPVHCPCNHVFCRACISKWLLRNRNCPICRKRTGLYSIQDVVPLIRNMINKLILRCHNLEKGCEEKFTLEACESHLKNSCFYELVKCKNKACKHMVLRKDMDEDCSHRYVKCKKCGLKVFLMNDPQKHDCLKELKQCLQEKMQIIKKKKQKIRELQSEVKTIKEIVSSDHSVTDSSVDSIGGTAFILSLNESSLSSGSSISSIPSFVSNSDNDSMSFWQNTSDILQEFQMPFNEAEADYSAGYTRASSPPESLPPPPSPEYPRASSPLESPLPAVGRSDASLEATLDVLSERDSPIRRPAKRRLPAALLDTSDEDEEVRELPSLPSPKRVWRLHRDDGGETSQGMYMNLTSEETPGSAVFDVAGPSSVPNTTFGDVDLRGLPRARRFLRSRRLGSPLCPPFFGSPVGDLPRAQVESPASTGRNGGGFLESTIAMLSTSNLESDPEWLPDEQPDQLGSTDYPALDLADVYRVSSEYSDSDSSSSSDSDSESGSEEPDLLSRIRNLFSSSDDEDDPDFQPSEDF
ncbi:hypothetical protein JTE90_014756 [Oedothorax gibbosus]|uniref:RING-type domain-containing protein n=1 Tax=Oedothorax gibbosus TaxID=931172 RepID=A0AAV6UQC9_9ARAC|nr:hypothetical protein JTE90_014756 [Oedothorax gibbosus]